MERQSKSKEREKSTKIILITGSKGRVGQVLTKSLAEDFKIIEIDIRARGDDKEEFNTDISNAKAVDETFKKIGKIDCVIHLAANPDETAPWEEILQNNIQSTKNIYEAARKNGIKKIIFASSTHLFGGYTGYPQTSPLNKPIKPGDYPRPDSDYGTSKGFGELLARQYYDLYGIKTICIRIGAFSNDPLTTGIYEKLWLSPRDATQVFRKAIETKIPFGIYFATSDNKGGIFDISKTKKELGYDPVDGIGKTIK
jgi:nucleoside-diphosphate-sugar epimerase